VGGLQNFIKETLKKNKYILVVVRTRSSLNPPSTSTNTEIMATHFSLLVFLPCMWQEEALPMPKRREVEELESIPSTT